MKKETKCKLHFFEKVEYLVLRPDGELYLRSHYASIYSTLDLYNERLEDGFVMYDMFNGYEFTGNILFDPFDFDTKRYSWTSMNLTKELEMDEIYRNEYEIYN